MVRCRRLVVLLTAAGVAAVFATPASAGGIRAADGAAAVVDGPGVARTTAVVALGDSAASGEGAGDYEPGTRGEGGDWCHRSAHAYVHRTGLATTSINLACSGAAASDVAFGSTTHHTEPSQAARLVGAALAHRVTTVVVQVGANDDAALTDTAIACVRALLDVREPPCRVTLGPLVPARMAATAGRVEAAVRDVREAMRRAGYHERGYGDGGYGVVLASYAAPVTERMAALHAVRGCPYSRADAGWARTVLFPALAAALAAVAARTGARFLDLTRSAEGYEACARPSPAQEWHRRITVDARALVHGGLGAIGSHLAQESLHPSAGAHREIGRCLGEFVRSRAPTGSCLVGGDGRLELRTGRSDPARAP